MKFNIQAKFTQKLPAKKNSVNLCNKKSNFKKSLGFTLIEVMVALFILAIISMSATQVIDSQVNISQRHRDYALSNLCASNLVANWQLDAFYPDVGRQEGETNQLGLTCYWRLDTSATAIKNMMSGTLRIFSDKEREKPIGKYDIFLGL